MKTSHNAVRSGAARTAAVTGTLCLGLSAAAQPSHATASSHPAAPAQGQRAATSPVAVINGDFAQPAFNGNGPDWSAVRGWSVGSTNGAGTGSGVARYSGTASGHPDGKIAVMLRLPNASYAFKQRLRGVRSCQSDRPSASTSVGAGNPADPARALRRSLLITQSKAAR